MLRFTLIAMLFASTPAVADPAQGIEGRHERFDVDTTALQDEEKALQRQVYGESSGIGFTFCSAFVRGLTLGVSPIVVRYLTGPSFPAFDEAREINPRTSAVGTILGVIVLAGIVYTSRVLALLRRRSARYVRNFVPMVKQPDAPAEPDEPDGIVGSFITRDGYDFVVMRDSRNVDDTLN